MPPIVNAEALREVGAVKSLDLQLAIAGLFQILYQGLRIEGPIAAPQENRDANGSQCQQRQGKARS